MGKLLVTLVTWYQHFNLYCKKSSWRPCPFSASLGKGLSLNADRHPAYDLAWSSTLTVTQPGATWEVRRTLLPSSAVRDNSFTHLTTSPKPGYSRLSHCTTHCPIPKGKLLASRLFALRGLRMPQDKAYGCAAIKKFQGTFPSFTCHWCQSNMSPETDVTGCPHMGLLVYFITYFQRGTKSILK